MALQRKQFNFDVWTISSADDRCHMSFVPEKGGIGSSLIMCDAQQQARELLFQHDFFWDKNSPRLGGAWPFLFPICARLERDGKLGDYLYDGKIYNLPSHGFAPFSVWQVKENASKNSITLCLKDSEQTREQFPFEFEVSLKYTLQHNQLFCEQEYKNNSSCPMPYYAGFHPYFSIPVNKASVQLNYQPVRRYQYNDRLTNLIGEQALFNLPINIAEPSINEQLTFVAENKIVQLIFPDGFTINMEASGIEDPNLFSYVQLYHMPEKPFFCIEPWMSFPNSLNTVKGVRWLAPGASEHGLLKLWINNN